MAGGSSLAGRPTGQLAHDVQVPDVPGVLLHQVEKDALEEVDWKELVELRWKQSAPVVRDWVEYLRHGGGPENGGLGPAERPPSEQHPRRST